MGNLVFQATLGGQVNLVGPNTASTFNLNVPAVTSTIATLAAQTFAGTQTFTVNPVLSGGTINGVAYLNGSNVLTTGSALTFDGTNFTVGGTTQTGYKLQSYTASGNNGIGIFNGSDSSGDYAALSFVQAGNQKGVIYTNSENLTINSAAGSLIFQTGSTEQMRLTSTGLGIGTSSPNANVKLDVAAPIRAQGYTVATLPTGVVGARAYVTDAVAAVFQAVPTGGGSVKTPVFYNGTNWVCG